MKISEALERIDASKPNTFESREKIEWLARLDARIHSEIIMTHEHKPEDETFTAYSAETDGNTELLAEYPYDNLYIYYLESQIDYGNSYAQKAGQQAYQGYLQGLNDKVPELYQMALERYNQEGTDLLNKYGLMSDQYAKEYSRYRDSVGDWQNKRDYLATLYNNERSFDYTGYRDRVADEQWQKNFDEALRQYNENLAEQKRQYDASLASRYSSGGSSGGSGNSGSGKQYDTHGYTEGQIKALQRNAGLTPDGVWGAQTEKAYQNGYRWNSYRGATDKNGAMNQSYFDAYMSGIASNLRNGNTDSAKASAQQIVNSLSDEQYAKMKSVFAAHGISIG